jgi:hypothetical protein
MHLSDYRQEATGQARHCPSAYCPYGFTILYVVHGFYTGAAGGRFLGRLHFAAATARCPAQAPLCAITATARWLSSRAVERCNVPPQPAPPLHSPAVTSTTKVTGAGISTHNSCCNEDARARHTPGYYRPWRLRACSADTG